LQPTRNEDGRGFCIAAAVLALGTNLATANLIDLTSGTGGHLMADQSYNETRAIDVTVLSPDNLFVESMTLTGFNLYGRTDVVGARIYDTTTQSLIASASDTTPPTP
jgi:hypothetical protein